MHGSKPHFWARIDAGSFVAQKQIHGEAQVIPPSHSLLTRVGPAGGRLLLGFKVPGTGIHLCSLFLVCSRRASDFLYRLVSALEE